MHNVHAEDDNLMVEQGSTVLVSQQELHQAMEVLPQQ